MRKIKEKKEEDNNYVILPSIEKKPEEALKETEETFEKVQKKLTNFLGLVPFPIVAFIIFLLLSVSVTTKRTIDIVLCIISIFLGIINYMGTKKIRKMDIKKIGDIELRNAVNIFNANAPYVSTETGKKKLKIDYEKLKQLRNKIKK